MTDQKTETTATEVVSLNDKLVQLIISYGRPVKLVKRFEDLGVKQPTVRNVRMWKSRRAVPPAWLWNFLRICMEDSKITAGDAQEIMNKSSN